MEIQNIVGTPVVFEFVDTKCDNLGNYDNKSVSSLPKSLTEVDGSFQEEQEKPKNLVQFDDPSVFDEGIQNVRLSVSTF